MARKPRYIALDNEATGLHVQKGDRGFSVGLCDENDRTWFWDWPVNPFTRQPDYDSPQYKKAVKEIKVVLKNYDVVVYHNAKYDRLVLRHNPGMEWIADLPWEDTILFGHVIDASAPRGLKPRALLCFEIDDDDEKELRKHVQACVKIAKKKGWNVGDGSAGENYWLPKALDPKDTRNQRYNIQDCRRTIMLWLGFSAVATDADWKQYRRDIVKPLSDVTSEIEEFGVTLPRRRLNAEIKRYEREVAAAERTCRKIAKLPDLNLASPKQLGDLMYRQMGFEAVWSGESTNAATLRLLLSREKAGGRRAEFLTNLILHRRNDSARKAMVGYRRSAVIVDNKTLRLYGSINQTGTDTTRFSHSDPNTGNIGKGKGVKESLGILLEEGEEDEIDFTLRNVFGPAEGRMWYAWDYDQLQLRIFAERTGSPKMAAAFKAGYNFHNYIAAEIYGVHPNDVTPLQKRTGKNVNFGYIFGAKDAKIDATSGIRGLSKRLKVLFPEADDFIKSTTRQVEKTGIVYTAGGYPLRVPRDRAYAGVCYIVQGTEGEIVKQAMVYVHDLLKSRVPDAVRFDGHMTLQVHDEIVIDANRETRPKHGDMLQTIKKYMEKAGRTVGITTPVNCERILRDYSNGVKVKL